MLNWISERMNEDMHINQSESNVGFEIICEKFIWHFSPNIGNNAKWEKLKNHKAQEENQEK